MREVVDALVRALDAAADFGQVLGVLDADLVELAANLPQQFLEFLLERRLALEVVEDLEENEQDGAKRRGVDEPRGEPRRVGHRHFLREDEIGGEKEKGGDHIGCSAFSSQLWVVEAVSRRISPHWAARSAARARA